MLKKIINNFPYKEDIDIFFDVFCTDFKIIINLDYNKIISNDIDRRRQKINIIKNRKKIKGITFTNHHFSNLIQLFKQSKNTFFYFDITKLKNDEISYLIEITHFLNHIGVKFAILCNKNKISLYNKIIINDKIDLIKNF